MSAYSEHTRFLIVHQAWTASVVDTAYSQRVPCFVFGTTRDLVVVWAESFFPIVLGLCCRVGYWKAKNFSQWVVGHDLHLLSGHRGLPVPSVAWEHYITSYSTHQTWSLELMLTTISHSGSRMDRSSLGDTGTGRLYAISSQLTLNGSIRGISIAEFLPGGKKWCVRP